MARNHFWKQFENQCARTFGGDGRFPANQGGALDFETPYAIGQCKTTKATAKDGISAQAIGEIAYTLHRIAKVNQLGKWPVVCLKVRRGAGVRSEAVICLSSRAAADWLGVAVLSNGCRVVRLKKVGRGSADGLTRAVEAERQSWGLIVQNVEHPFVAIGWKKFFANYAFHAQGRKAGP